MDSAFKGWNYRILCEYSQFKFSGITARNFRFDSEGSGNDGFLMSMGKIADVVQGSHSYHWGDISRGFGNGIAQNRVQRQEIEMTPSTVCSMVTCAGLVMSRIWVTEGCGAGRSTMDFCRIHILFIDSVSITAIPEPSAFAILGLGCLALAARRCRWA